MPTKQINKPTSSSSKNKSKPMAKQTSAELVLEALETIAGNKKEPIGKEARVVKEGKTIVIPEGMSYDHAITWIQRQKESEEKVVAIYDTIPCYPLDGSVAVMNAIKDIYGFTGLTDTPGFFGSNPPLLVQVPLADGTFETALIGRIAIPKWEGGYIDLCIGREAEIVLNGQIKKKFEPELKAVVAGARERLRTSSIYKGQAIRVDLNFMHDEDHKFHPINDSPKFIDVESVDESSLILNDVTSFDLETHLFLLIEQSEDCKANNIPLKYGCLLAGAFGTGKTLTALVTAKKCVRNNWTFIYLQNSAHIAYALRLATLYAPAAVFSEDTDQSMSEGRTESVNAILNTMDGIDTKGAPIITILTTNNPDVIERAMLRPGRIDDVFVFEAPDAKTAVRFVDKLARNDDNHSLLEPGTDLTEVGEAMAGFVPAFIARAIEKAKQFVMKRAGKDIVGKVTAGDLILAAKSLRAQEARVNRPKTPTKEEKAHAAMRLVGDVMNQND